jgi:hypothetical protein
MCCVFSITCARSAVRDSSPARRTRALVTPAVTNEMKAMPITITTPPMTRPARVVGTTSP